jgi:DNA modification methylase
MGIARPTPQSRRERQRANDLDGREWTRCSISVWNDIRWSREEQQLEHPAMFPAMLVERLIRCFMRASDRVVLDPFLGSGSTLVAAQNLGRSGVGLEVYPQFIRLAQGRLKPAPPAVIHRADARRLRRYLEAGSVDFCVTSPPYWDILNQRRTADYKKARSYGNGRGDLGRLADYAAFLDELSLVFAGVYEVLKPGGYCVVNVMDLRKKSRFFPLHADLATRLQAVGFELDDLIVWDRRQEYNNLRPLGYPSVFRVNKIHEFLVIFRKPSRPPDSQHSPLAKEPARP